MNTDLGWFLSVFKESDSESKHKIDTKTDIVKIFTGIKENTDHRIELTEEWIGFNWLIIKEVMKSSWEPM